MSIDKISQAEILVRVDFYDPEEKAKLLQYPVSKNEYSASVNE